MSTSATISLRAALSERVRGLVLDAHDPRFAPEIAAFNTAVVHAPALVVAVESADDVVAAVGVAAEHGLRVRVQATGHGAHVPITDGMLISTRRLDRVVIDPEARTATIGGGARWAAVIAAAAPHGLAPVTGSSVTVGVAGYLLGGGVGPLARSHGFSSDYLSGLKLVTGTGQLIQVDAQQNADLFWALRGGKNGLGVVTEVHLRLVELRTLYAGALFFAEEQIEPVLRGWVDWTAQAHPHVTTSVALMHLPPLEAIPAPLRGRRLLGLRFAYPGALQEGERLAAPLRALAPVHLDALGALPAAEVARIHNDPPAPGPSWTTGRLLDGIDQDFASRLLEQAGPRTQAPFVAVEVRHLGEATRREVAGGCAVSGRTSSFTLGIVGVNPALLAEVIPAAAARLLEAVRPWTSPLTNVNLSGDPHTPEEIARTWPAATLARLREIRRRHDPQGVFG
jgi:FAD/FMN-containing dehydrogenase